MALYDEVTGKYLCECGCGQECTPWSSFRPGHYSNREVANRKISEAMSGRVKFLDKELCEKISEGVKRAYQEDPTYAERNSESHQGLCYLLDEGFHERKSEGMKLAYLEDPTLRERISKATTGLVRTGQALDNITEGNRQKYIDDPTIGDRISGTLGGTCKLLDREYCRRQSVALNKAYDENPELAERYRGENHYNWKGGFTGGYGYGWSAIRDLILTRDNYTCQNCGSGINLEVHHIDGFTFNVGKENLITTCHSCNMKAASKNEEDYWLEFYRNKMREICKDKQLRISQEDL